MTSSRSAQRVVSVSGRRLGYLVLTRWVAREDRPGKGCAYGVEGGREADPGRIAPGLSGGLVDDLPEGLVAAGQGVELLADDGRGLGVECRVRPADPDLEDLDQGLDAPAGGVESRDLLGVVELVVGQGGDQGEDLADPVSRIADGELDHPHGHRLVLAPAEQFAQVGAVRQPLRGLEPEIRGDPDREVRVAAIFRHGSSEGKPRSASSGMPAPIAGSIRSANSRSPTESAAASITARVPHSTSATSRNCGNQPPVGTS